MASASVAGDAGGGLGDGGAGTAVDAAGGALSAADGRTAGGAGGRRAVTSTPAAGGEDGATASPVPTGSLPVEVGGPGPQPSPERAEIDRAPRRSITPHAAAAMTPTTAIGRRLSAHRPSRSYARCAQAEPLGAYCGGRRPPSESRTGAVVRQQTIVQPRHRGERSVHRGDVTEARAAVARGTQHGHRDGPREPRPACRRLVRTTRSPAGMPVPVEWV